ncbi:winged helix-turn-helix transcriptional regulator [Streptomyces thermodiastaticus]|jgi:DNA-binding HxlR family transcriptional regulator|uniref:winged helix-turn-helix transcriptional regulator n=1 Tax=Streptomyces thermodiastaticus TaxID=44061 RepID=UPI00167354C0|nr:helix-turn-helix domain-containing protein [Streptomyces thermodiastaticus]MCE7548928.1 helix-turn-helix transcriptional regulator [Streptomyces thermodiastaticus]GHF75400.1 HxlR family transcriptional regulator [Streptomyces thermodiastaticus]
MAKTLGKDATCSIARALEVLGDTWTVLIIREALIAGSTRFQEFRDALGIAPNILSRRLETLVEQGIFERRAYREPGERSRYEYVLSDAGRGLNVVIAALADWSRQYRPQTDGTSPRFISTDDGTVAELAFVTEEGSRIAPARLVARRMEDALLRAS